MSDFASICILSYQRLGILRRCLESIYATLDYKAEIIINDDGSDNEVRDYLMGELKAKRISWLILNGGTNMGTGRSMRNCFDLSRGQYIVKLDADMQFLPGWLSTSISLLDAFPTLGVLGLFRYAHKPVDFRDMLISTVTGSGLAYEEHRDFVGSAMLMRRDVYEQSGPIGEGSAAYAEDYIFKMKVQERGLHLGLPLKDLALNESFGIGRSVVVQEDGQVRPVCPFPLLFSPPPEQRASLQ